MNEPLFLLALVGLIPAFMALLISTLFKRYLIPNHPIIFKQTLKFGLLGTFFGLVIFVVTWTIRKNETNSWATPGSISMIPFYSMLVGEILGVYLTNRKNK